MKDSKLIRYFKLLSKQELNEFGRVVKNSYFNRREGPIALYDQLKKAYPEFNSRILQKEILFKSLFGSSAIYDSKKIEDTAYHLTRLLTNYIENKELEQNSILKKFTYLNALISRGALDLFHSEAPKILIQINKTNEKLSSSFYLYQIRNLMYCFPEKGNVLATPTAELLNITKDLDHFYFVNKLFYASELKVRTEIDVENYQQDFLKEIVQYVENNSDSNPQLLVVIYNLFIVSDSSFKDYLQLKELVFSSLDLFTQPMRVRIITSLINRCKVLYPKYAQAAVSEWFQLYQKLVETNLLFEMNMINQTTFINIIHLGCNQKETDWVQSFVIKSKPYIKDEDLFVLGRAMVLFAKSNFKEVIQLLYTIDFSNIHRNITCRSLLIKSYFELEDYDILDNQLNAFEIFLRRNLKNAPDFLKTNLNFSKMLKALVRVKFQSKDAKVKLIEKMKTSNKLAYKSWLLEKATSL